jgi:hypothetical protein
MKRSIIFAVLIIVLALGSFAQEGFQGRPITNNVRMSTGYTLNKGEFTIGLGSIGFGITDRVQFGTNVLLFLFQDYNGNLKVSLLESESMAVAAGLSFNYFDLKVFGADSGFTSVSPFVSISPRISEKTVLHLGAQYTFFSGDEDIDDAEISSTVRGTSVSTGLEYSFSNKTKFLAEGGYDTTFNGIRFGGAVLFGWDKFRLKLGVNYFKPEDTRGFTLPIIGIWWRFAG